MEKIEPDCAICSARICNSHGKVILPHNERERKFVCVTCCSILKQLPLLTVENEKVKT